MNLLFHAKTALKNFIMSLEKDITQLIFVTKHQKAAINLIYSYNWANERMKPFF